MVCIQDGMEALAAANRSHGESLVRLGPLLPLGGWRNAPSSLGLEQEGTGGALATVGEARVERWFALAKGLHGRREQARLVGARWVARELRDIEDRLRSGLRSAAAAYNFFDDVRWDLPGSTMIEHAGQEVGRVDELLGESHRLAHALGDLIGGLFGCVIVHDDGGWYDECVSSLLHVRYGNSMGFTARHECSICRQDFSGCDHLRQASYPITVARDEAGLCTVCGEAHCEHIDGTVIDVTARTTMTDIKLHEVSMVPRPRDPLARISAREVDIDNLIAHLGYPPEPHHRVLDHGCMYQCHGLTGPESADQVGWFNVADATPGWPAAARPEG
jgi:hypothetical protein